PNYGRLSKFFGEVDGDNFRRLMHFFVSQFDGLSEELRSLPFHSNSRSSHPPSDVTGFAARVLPPDDSALQFSPAGGGLTEDPEATLAELYERYVLRYAERPHKPSRSDEEVLRVFKRPLVERRLLARIRPKRIVTSDYEHEFPLAWRNGQLNLAEPLSFDLADAGYILEKANTWLGRAWNLKEYEAQEAFTLYILLGHPQSDRLRVPYTKAKNILHKMPCKHELVSEEEADDFAGTVQHEVGVTDQGVA
ncbi:MAG: DUF3037 domain-containing protein, partial [Armatimonadetes bacterium]|nr:DUF3037 domain-containing protein [Armatimonadota bacterium]